MYLCYWHDMFILIECHSFLSPNKVNIQYVCVGQCGTSSYKNYTSYRFGVIPIPLPHELYLSFSVKKWNSVIHWCAPLVQPVFFFIGEQYLNRPKPIRNTVQTSPHGLVPIVVPLTKYYAFHVNPNRKVSAYQMFMRKSMRNAFKWLSLQCSCITENYSCNLCSWEDY